MNWKKLHTDIQNFATANRLKLEELNTTYPKGRLTMYQLVEDSKIFYEIRHSKPVADYGSKIRVYAKTKQHISIVSKSNWLGKQSLKIDGELSEETNILVHELVELIGSFCWNTEIINPDWPEVLRGQQCLKFECRQIDLAVEALERIRALHSRLSAPPSEQS
ncbi:MAG: hypothetical protein Roseis2KO_57010 [Roseivirga sp.]